MRLPRTASGTRRGPLAGASNRQRIAAAAGGPSSGAVPAKSLRRNGTSQQQQQQQPSKAPGQALATAASRGLAAGLAALLLAGSPAPPAAAVLSMPRGQLPRTAEIALRRSIPAYNPDVKAIQDQLEDIAFKLRIPQRKPWNGMSESLAAAVELARDDRAMLAGVLPPNEEQAQQLLADIRVGLGRLADAVAAKDPDRTSLRVAQLLRQVGNLELLQAPGLPFNLPRQYASLPRLTGRAEVELVLKEQGGQIAKLRIVLDGYSAPLTAGNFAANVADGLYNGAKLSASYNSVLVGQQVPGAAIPLEMLAAGEFEPQYRVPLDVLGDEMPVLPLSINGALAMARLEGPDGNGSAAGLVSARQFFIYKFDRSQAGLAGLSFDEGEFGVFGYVTEGADELGRLGGGDMLVSARLVSGADKLVRPATADQAAAAAASSE